MSSIDFAPIAVAKQAQRLSLIPTKWRLTTSQLTPPSEAPSNWALSVPRSCGLLSARELEITESDATALLERLHTLREERWTAAEVLVAFAKRASVAQQLTNCLTEIFFEEAKKRAKELDEHLEKHGKPVGPLHGLPVSIKDCFDIKGLDTTVGFLTFANEPRERDALLVSILRNAGAVLFCKTNVPTAMMIAETLNNVWGRTSNPHRLDYTSGGSSGGEAALIAMRGSPLGVGTDVGGSIRFPAAMCGIYGLKPSSGRFSTWGVRSGMPGQDSVASSSGPMATSLRDIELLFRVVIDSQSWQLDPKLIPLPYTPATLPRTRLVFGLLLDDGLVHPTPPIQRALLQTAHALRRAGHTVLPWDDTQREFLRCAKILFTLYTADGRRGIGELMKRGGEETQWVKGLREMSEPIAVAKLSEVIGERHAWAQRINAQWQSLTSSKGGVMDALICPVAPVAGAKHDSFTKHNYAAVWNAIDWPALTIPITHVLSELDQVREPPRMHGDKDEAVWNVYDEKAQHGLPVCIQLVARRSEEEKLLALAKVVVDAVESDKAS